MMEDLYRITKVPAAIMDNNHNILLSNGLQEICIKFHWGHPEANSNCPVGEFGPHSSAEHSRCNHYLYDVMLPIQVNERQLGYLLIGQFLLEDKEAETERFRDQARKYGFDEKEYLWFNIDIFTLCNKKIYRRNRNGFKEHY